MKTPLTLIAATLGVVVAAQAAFADSTVTKENREEQAVARSYAEVPATRYQFPLAIAASRPFDAAQPQATRLNPTEDPHWGPAQDATDN